jgi:Mrp family chromosome partitioning ATPase
MMRASRTSSTGNTRWRKPCSASSTSRPRRAGLGSAHVDDEELLGSVSFRRIIDEARERYDIIIIDAPPVLNVSDTIIISKLVDKVLFVVAMEKTNRGLVREAKKGLDKVSVKTMGMILTNMTINPRSYYYGSANADASRGRH